MSAPQPLAASCRMALKEWASVVEAFRVGEQMVLIRKGGLIEPGSGFELQAEQFLFYPTFEHQTVNFIREPFRAGAADLLSRKSSDGVVRIDCCGIAVHSAQVMDPAIITRLEPFHLYNDAFLQQRLKWQPRQPLVVVVARAFRLPSVRQIPMAAHYAGCKSWVELDAPVSLEGAQPALDEAVFNRKLDEIRAVLRP